MINRWEKWITEHNEESLSDLLTFLRFPSISALPEHRADVEDAARWVASRLTKAGVDGVRVIPTSGHPVVYGEWLHAPGKATVLVYGHFDTQPADPLDEWTSPPFEPVVKDGVVYARGASDDKGNMLAPILAVEAMLATDGRLPLNLKFLFEGQEEIGSPDLAPFLAQAKEMLACDLVVSADGDQYDESNPALFVGLKGLCGLQIDVRGPATDVHSGGCGGGIANPIQSLVDLLGTMKSPDGRITVEGFYDDVVPISDADRARMAAIPIDDATILKQMHVEAGFGEPGYSLLERLWMRPTLELNGIWGGFQGEGVKTVIPSEAHAKITCRLVANQSPQKTIETLVRHVNTHLPPAVNVTVTPYPAGADPYLMPADHPGNKITGDVLRSIYNSDPYFIMAGGSIPIYGLFLKHLGVYSVTYGFALNGDGAHGPNEFFGLDRFKLAQEAYCLIFEALGERGAELKSTGKPS